MKSRSKVTELIWQQHQLMKMKTVYAFPPVYIFLKCTRKSGIFLSNKTLVTMTYK